MKRRGSTDLFDGQVDNHRLLPSNRNTSRSPALRSSHRRTDLAFGCGRGGLLVVGGELRRRKLGGEERAGAEGDDRLLVFCERSRHRLQRQLGGEELESVRGDGKGSGRGMLSDQARSAMGDKVPGGPAWVPTLDGWLLLKTRGGEVECTSKLPLPACRPSALLLQARSSCHLGSESEYGRRVDASTH